MSEQVRVSEGAKLIEYLYASTEVWMINEADISFSSILKLSSSRAAFVDDESWEFSHASFIGKIMTPSNQYRILFIFTLISSLYCFGPCLMRRSSIAFFLIKHFDMYRSVLLLIEVIDQWPSRNIFLSHQLVERELKKAVCARLVTSRAAPSVGFSTAKVYCLHCTSAPTCRSSERSNQCYIIYSDYKVFFFICVDWGVNRKIVANCLPAQRTKSVADRSDLTLFH